MKYYFVLKFKGGKCGLMVFFYVICYGKIYSVLIEVEFVCSYLSVEVL